MNGRERLVDISVAVTETMPTWPGSSPPILKRVLRLEAGDPSNVSRLDMEVHTGTHVDAPWHFLADHPKMDAIGLEDLVGPAFVAHFPEALSITARELEAARIPSQVTRLLLRTRNSLLWAANDTKFHEDFVALTADAAQWIVERGIRLIGNDYLSVQRFHDGPQTHHILLRAGVIVVEGLDLSRADPGPWELICLPLRIPDADGAPARAVLRRELAP